MAVESYEVAIVGGGPAGATAARCLAAGGARVILFDHSHPREKPCGGGISGKARGMLPELDRLADQGRSGTQLRLVAPAGFTVTVSGDGRTFAIDRVVLDRALLAEAVRAGAAWRAEQVVEWQREDAGYLLSTTRGTVRTRILIGADGVFSRIRRRLVGRLPDRHLAFGAQVLVPELNPPSALLEFFGDRRGFAWVFNRRTQSAIGVGMPKERMNDWRERLTAFFNRQAPGRPLPPIHGWWLPQVKEESGFTPLAAGDDWLLIGDAAGHVDPLTGEGIWYAMWGGRLAAEAVLAGRPARYDRDWREAYLPRFLRHLRQAAWLEHRRAVDALLFAARLPGIGKRLFGKIGGG